MNNKELEHLMTAAGVRPSPVRTLVARTLHDAPGPMTSLEIERQLVTVDRSSITRTLAIFDERRLVHRVDDGSGSVKFELCRAHGHHHEDDGPGADPDRHPHFHCISCGRTFCLDDVPIPAVALPAGFLARSANFVINGLCPRCQS